MTYRCDRNWPNFLVFLPIVILVMGCLTLTVLVMGAILQYEVTRADSLSEHCDLADG